MAFLYVASQLWRERCRLLHRSRVRRLPLHGFLCRSCLRLVLRLKGLHLVYCPPINSRFRTGDLHPTSSRPCRAYREPERRIARELESTSTTAARLRWPISGESLLRNKTMTMPGFVFHFHCGACDASSHDYAVYVFSDLFRPSIILPAWSLTHKCWASIQADLSTGQRRTMESAREILLSFAASLSSDNLTVGVPRMSAGESDSFTINVTPDPICPHCGANCQSPFGYPPRPDAPTIPTVSIAEFRAAPISLIDLSVRATMICHDLGFNAVGDIEDGRSRFAAHPRATETTILEIDRLLSRKPVADA